MPISISTMGKFGGPPTKEAAADYGGGSTSPPPPKQHKFPKLRITSIEKKEEDDINIDVNLIEDSDHES